MVRIRLWRVLLLVGIFVVLFCLPFALQAMREQQRRRSVQENLEQLQKALSEYEARHSRSADKETSRAAPDSADE